MCQCIPSPLDTQHRAEKSADSLIIRELCAYSHVTFSSSQRQTNALLHRIISVPTSSARRNILAKMEAFVKSHSRRSGLNGVQVPTNTQKKHADNLIYTISRFEGKAEEGFKDPTGPLKCLNCASTFGHSWTIKSILHE